MVNSQNKPTPRRRRTQAATRICTRHTQGLRPQVGAAQASPFLSLQLCCHLTRPQVFGSVCRECRCASTQATASAVRPRMSRLPTLCPYTNETSGRGRRRMGAREVCDDEDRALGWTWWSAQRVSLVRSAGLAEKSRRGCTDLRYPPADNHQTLNSQSTLRRRAGFFLEVCESLCVVSSHELAMEVWAECRRRSARVGGCVTVMLVGLQTSFSVESEMSRPPKRREATTTMTRRTTRAGTWRVVSDAYVVQWDTCGLCELHYSLS